MSNKIFKSIRDSFFDHKLIIKRLIIFSIALTIVLCFSLPFFFAFKNFSDEYIPFGSNKFLYLKIKWNDGIAFNKLKNNFAIIYFVQIFFLSLLTIYISLAKKTWSICFISLAICGGLFNLLQRFFYDGKNVLDYFCFGFFDFAIFNFPDVFIVIGFIGHMLFSIISLIIEIKNDNKSN